MLGPVNASLDGRQPSHLCLNFKISLPILLIVFLTYRPYCAYLLYNTSRARKMRKDLPVSIKASG